VDLTSFFVLLGFTLIFGKITWVFLRHKLSWNHLVGRTTLVRLQFYFAKGTLAVTWVLMIMNALFPTLGYLQSPLLLKWSAIVLLYIGGFILTSGINALGRSFRIGIPMDDTIFVTSGIFRISRNPVYFGAFLISISSSLYFPDLVNITFTIFSIIMHHRIILNEEHYLTGRFRNAYSLYRSRTRRYI
jgi:protein-S-isoprenylcysteine O-methyltransferase Ste14